MNTTQKSNNLVEISTDSEHILHRIGDEEYPIIRKIMTLNPSEWEEVAVADIPPYTEGEYAYKVAELVHERYSIDAEIALINNIREESPSQRHLDEYATYTAYRKECKERAKEFLTNRPRADEPEGEPGGE